MIGELDVVADPGPAEFAAVEATSPANPFYTQAFAAAMSDTGSAPRVIRFRGFGGSVTCVGFVRSGRLSRSLQLTSVPTLGSASAGFWASVLAYCTKARITELVVQSFGSSESLIPPLATETSRAQRVEFVLDLDGNDPWERLDKKHRQSITKCRQHNVQIEQTSAPSAVDEHAALMGRSLDRHKSLGANVVANVDTESLRALLRHGAATLYRATLEGRVLSSASVLRSKTGAYYHTAGNHPDGLALGASHLLLYEISRRLTEEGAAEFNFGGTQPANEGLVRFKTRFGTRRVDLEAASFDLGGRLRRALIAASRELRGGLR
jgi:hypothetical protein